MTTTSLNKEEVIKGNNLKDVKSCHFCHLLYVFL